MNESVTTRHPASRARVSSSLSSSSLNARCGGIPRECGPALAAARLVCDRVRARASAKTSSTRIGVPGGGRGAAAGESSVEARGEEFRVVGSDTGTRDVSGTRTPLRSAVATSARRASSASAALSLRSSSGPPPRFAHRRRRRASSASSGAMVRAESAARSTTRPLSKRFYFSSGGEAFSRRTRPDC